VYAAANWVVRLHATRSGLLLLIGVLVIVVAASAFASADGRRRYGPIRVLSDQQPGLVTLVADTARQMNVVEPDRIWIVADARVTAVVARRRDLYVGLPLLLTLSDTELRALAAHELSIMSRPRRAVQLYRAWAAARARVDVTDGVSKVRRRDVRLVAALDGLATEIGVAADHAAAVAVGRNDAMVAVARADYLGLDFSFFVTLLTANLGPRIDGKLLKIEDVHDGWLRRCRAGAGLPALDIAEFDAWWPFPFFATIPRSAIGRMLTVTPSAHPIAVDPVTVLARQRLSAALMPDRPRKQRRQWCTFATAPAELWRREAESLASDVVAAVTTVLGREPVDRAEAADVVRTRVIDVCIAQGWATTSEDVSVVRATVSMWLELLEGALLGTGWLRVDPVVPGILRSPAGQVLDGRDLTDCAMTDDAAYADLRGMLHAPVLSSQPPMVSDRRS
jgi:hypothetical protein